MDQDSLILNRIGELITWNSRTGAVETHHHCFLRISEGKIDRIGPELPLDKTHYDCNYALVTPGFIDSHTHPVFLGGRENEFKMRISGSSYQEISASGGGINSSITGVREADLEDLTRAVTRRMDRFLALGTTTVEAKSGYGLSLESELKSLKVLETVNRNHPVTVLPTFMGAHAFPPEFSSRQEKYVDLICEEMLPAVAEQGIARFCDVFCEKGYFNVAMTRRILEKARESGLKIRLHADEFSDSGAAELAGELKAMSADHLMAVSEKGLKALAENGVTATLLPGTTFFLGLQDWAPARKMIDVGINVAMATDYNPGSCMIQSMPFIVSLGCIYLGLTTDEAFAAVSYFAARSLGIENDVGTLEPGMDADMVVWDVRRWEEIPYLVTNQPVKAVFKQGKLVS